LAAAQEDWVSDESCSHRESEPAEGKTTTACNLAVVLAETEQRIVLLDADVRRPMVHTFLGVSYKPGLSDFVDGRATYDEVVQRGVLENLDFVASGSTTPQASKILASRKMEDLVAELKAHYDLVVI